MRWRDSKTIFVMLSLSVSLIAGTASAEGFTSEKFMERPAAQQVGYFTASVTMVGVVVSQLDRNQARCIDEWYRREVEQNHRSLRDALRQNGTYHPQAVILWVIQNECGKISQTRR